MRISHLFILLAASAMLTACDFLDEYNPNSVTVGNYYTSEEDIVASLNGVYTSLTQSYVADNYHYFTDVRANATVVTNSGANSGIPYQFYNYTLTEENVYVYNRYSQLYKIISRANTLFAHLGDVSYATPSARDTYEALYSRGVNMEAKAFAVGVRIEHSQALINKAQYGPFAAHPKLGAADYALIYHDASGRAVYSFCMCPGGEVFAAASEAGGVCTNGMSNSRRDGENANAAVLVTLRPEDFPDKSTLGGMYWQRSIEQRAFARGGGNYHAPAQLAGDFLAGRASTGPGRVQPTYRPGVTWCDLHDMLPARITDTLAQALPAFGRKLRGFDDPDAVLTAPETRSSSPVRIVRGEDRCSTGVPGLYPCGEGAGYAGGITSAAVDGLRCAESVLAALQNEA